jgi:hypothetical protein
MFIRSCALVVGVWAALLAFANPRSSAQTLGEPEDFTAIAVANNEIATGAGTVLIHISRWSTERTDSSHRDAAEAGRRRAS